MRLPRTLNKRERRLAIVTLVALVAGLAYVYLVEPVATAWMQAHGAASAAEAELTRLQSLLANRDRIEREFQAYAGAMATGLSEEALQVDLLKEIQEIAGRSGVEITSMKPLRTQPDGRMTRVGIEVHGVCAGHEFVRFLQSCQDAAHLLRAEEINVVVGRDMPPLTVTLELTKLVYSQSDTSRAGA